MKKPRNFDRDVAQDVAEILGQQNDKMRSALERIAALEQGWAQAPALAREVLAEIGDG